MAVRVGIDLGDVGEVRESLRAHGRRYLDRIYTEGEQRDCGGDPRRLAAAYAAKEATAKALSVADEAFSWLSVGIGRDAGGRPSITLSDEVATLAGIVVRESQP